MLDFVSSIVWQPWLCCFTKTQQIEFLSKSTRKEKNLTPQELIEAMLKKHVSSLFCYLQAITWFQFVVTMYGEKDPAWKRRKTLHHQIGFLISHLVTIPLGTTQRYMRYVWGRQGRSGLEICHIHKTPALGNVPIFSFASGLFSAIFLLLACLSFFCVSSS